MCEWLKKIFGFKCSCKHCHCGEENKEMPAVANTTAPEQAAPVASPEVPAHEATNETEKL